MMRLLLALLLFVLPIGSAFAVNPDEVLADPALEARARAISAYHSSRVCAGSLRAAKRRSHWPDLINPSSTELTRMRGANSRASDFTRLCAPARAAAVATICGSGS